MKIRTVLSLLLFYVNILFFSVVCCWSTPPEDPTLPKSMDAEINPLEVLPIPNYSGS